MENIYSKDDWYFKNSEKIYNPETKKFYDNPNISTRYEWNIWRKHVEKGATYKNYIENEPNRRKTKGQGGTTDLPPRDTELPRKYKKKILTPFDIEDLFSFNYDDMINSKPNKKFNMLMDLVFKHEFYDYNRDLEYSKYVEKYADMKENGELLILNDLYQRLSSYIIENNLGKENVDGSIICNCALIFSDYMKNGSFNTDFNYLNNYNEYNSDDDFRFHLFLILQCFTSKNRYYIQYINGKKIKEWWAICHLRHRFSKKDMKTKGQCSGFRDNNGKYIVKSY